MTMAWSLIPRKYMYLHTEPVQVSHPELKGWLTCSELLMGCERAAILFLVLCSHHSPGHPSLSFAKCLACVCVCDKGAANVTSCHVCTVGSSLDRIHFPCILPLVRAVQLGPCLGTGTLCLIYSLLCYIISYHLTYYT